jgi:hypothetical protein
MTAFNAVPGAWDETRVRRDPRGKFDEKQQSAAEVELTWVVEGDDHEVEVVQAPTQEEAASIVADVFNERYGDEDDASFYEPEDFEVLGAFDGDDSDDEEDRRYLPAADGVNREARARRALRDY